MDVTTEKENVSDKDEIDCPIEDLPLMPTANIFIKEEHDFDIVSLSSNDECDEKNVVINVSDDSLGEKRPNNDNVSHLNLTVWRPVGINFQRDGSKVVFNEHEGDSQISDADDDDDDDDDDEDDSCKDTDESYSDEFINEILNGRKRKKLLKMRRKKRKIETYNCEICGAKFNSVLEFNVHTLTTHNINNNAHLRKRQFTCQLCKRIFPLKSKLTKHMTRMHTEERSINCVKCNKQFMYRSYLTGSRNLWNKRNPSSCDNKQEKKFTCFYCNLHSA